MSKRHAPETGREAVAALPGVSRETMAKLDAYAAMLVDWNTRLNLIGRSTVPALWTRHMLDSLQLLPLLPRLPSEAPAILDMGSGAGFPGLPLALATGRPFVLAETNRNKAAFLREVIRATGAPATVHDARIERLQPWAAPVVTARALASVSELLALALPFTTISSVCLFPKGQNVEEELTKASESWTFQVHRHPSRTHARGVILDLRRIARR